MPPHRVRFTIGQVMAAVAVSAEAMALVGPRFAPVLLAILLAPVAIFVAARRRGVARCRILAWLLVTQPPVLLAAHYAWWVLICMGLGHRPGSAMGDRQWRPGFPAADLEAIAAVLLITSVPAGLLCAGFVLAEIVGTKDDSSSPATAALVMSAFVSWFSLILLVSRDFAGSFAWLLD